MKVATNVPDQSTDRSGWKMIPSSSRSDEAREDSDDVAPGRMATASAATRPHNGHDAEAVAARGAHEMLTEVQADRPSAGYDFFVGVGFGGGSWATVPSKGVAVDLVRKGWDWVDAPSDGPNRVILRDHMVWRNEQEEGGEGIGFGQQAHTSHSASDAPDELPASNTRDCSSVSHDSTEPMQQEERWAEETGDYWRLGPRLRSLSAPSLLVARDTDYLAPVEASLMSVSVEESNDNRSDNVTGVGPGLTWLESRSVDIIDREGELLDSCASSTVVPYQGSISPVPLHVTPENWLAATECIDPRGTRRAPSEESSPSPSVKPSSPSEESSPSPSPSEGSSASKVDGSCGCTVRSCSQLLVTDVNRTYKEINMGCGDTERKSRALGSSKKKYSKAKSSSSRIKGADTRQSYAQKGLTKLSKAPIDPSIAREREDTTTTASTKDEIDVSTIARDANTRHSYAEKGLTKTLNLPMDPSGIKREREDATTAASTEDGIAVSQVALDAKSNSNGAGRNNRDDSDIDEGKARNTVTQDAQQRVTGDSPKATGVVELDEKGQLTRRWPSNLSLHVDEGTVSTGERQGSKVALTESEPIIGKIAPEETAPSQMDNMTTSTSDCISFSGERKDDNSDRGEAGISKIEALDIQPGTRTANRTDPSEREGTDFVNKGVRDLRLSFGSGGRLQLPNKSEIETSTSADVVPPPPRCLARQNTRPGADSVMGVDGSLMDDEHWYGDENLGFTSTGYQVYVVTDTDSSHPEPGPEEGVRTCSPRVQVAEPVDRSERSLPSTSSSPFVSAFRIKTSSTGKYLFAVVLIMAILAVLLGSLFSSRSAKIDTNVNSTPVVPSPTIQSRASDRYLSIRDVLTAVSGTNYLDNVSSPQHRALSWIADDDAALIDPQSPARIIQRYTLALLFYSTGGEWAWTEQFNFLSDIHECDWGEYHVSWRLVLGVGGCNIDGHVTFLNLHQNGLAGTIPSELGFLEYLVEVQMWGNNVVGTIPKEIGRLTRLTKLGLLLNQLTGTLPSEIANLSRLTGLGLFGNQLSGSLPTELGRMTNLELFYLNRNTLTGTIPSELGNLESILELRLDFNNLTGTIPTDIGRLRNATEIEVNGNSLNGTVPTELWQLTKLLQLFLSENQLTGTISTEIGLLSDLRFLVMHENELSGTVPRELGNLSMLKALYLDANALTGRIPTEIGNLRNLGHLLLGYNEITGTIPTELGNLHMATWLGMQNNSLTGRIPTEIGGMRSLWNLWMGKNLLDGFIPTEFGNLTELDDLYLDHNSLSGTIPSEIGSLTILINVRLQNNNLSGTVPHSFSNLTLADTIYLEENNITGSVDFLCKTLDAAELQVDEEMVTCSCCFTEF